MKIKKFNENTMPNPTTEITFEGHELEVEYVHDLDNDDTDSNAGVFYIVNVWINPKISRSKFSGHRGNNKINITTLLGSTRIVDIEKQIHDKL